MVISDRSTPSHSTSSWEPEPLELPLELPRLPPGQDPGDSGGEDDEPRPGSRVVVLDLA